MSKIQPPKIPKKPTQQTTQQYQRELPIWCRGIMGGCVNCGGCI